MSSNNRSSHASGIGFTGVLQVALIVLKLCGVIEWSWFWVLAPIWIDVVILIILFIFAIFLSGKGDVDPGTNLLDRWWNGLDLQEKRNAACNASADCATCPLLTCTDCSNVGKVEEFIERHIEGRWIQPEEHEFFKCSKCGYIALFNDAGDMQEQVFSRFCPGCGAKMEGAEE